MQVFKRLTVFCAVFVALAGPAAAQVTVEPKALDNLDGTAPAETPKPPARPTPRPAPRPAPSRPVRPPVHAPEPPPPKPQLPPVPTTPPPLPVIPPAIPVPTRPPPPAIPVPIVADAPGEATVLPDGLRITFGADRADLNKDTDAALRDLAHKAPPRTRPSP